MTKSLLIDLSHARLLNLREKHPVQRVAPQLRWWWWWWFERFVVVVWGGG